MRESAPLGSIKRVLVLSCFQLLYPQLTFNLMFPAEHPCAEITWGMAHSPTGSIRTCLCYSKMNCTSSLFLTALLKKKPQKTRSYFCCFSLGHIFFSAAFGVLSYFTVSISDAAVFVLRPALWRRACDYQSNVSDNSVFWLFKCSLFHLGTVVILYVCLLHDLWSFEPCSWLQHFFGYL